MKLFWREKELPKNRDTHQGNHGQKGLGQSEPQPNGQPPDRMLELLPLAAYTCDAAGRITCFNDHAAKLWGRTPQLSDSADRFCGALRLLSTRGLPISLDQCATAAALRTGAAYQAEYVIERPDAQRTPVRAFSKPHYDSSGTLQGVTTILVDMSGRAQVENELRAKEAKYRAFFDHAVEGFFLTSPEGTFLELNPALASIYGYASPEDVITQFKDIATELFVDPSRRHEFIRLMDNHGVVQGFEFQVRRRDGSHAWVSENARAVRDSDGKLLWYEGTVEEITSRKRAEEALQRSQERLRSLIEAEPACVKIVAADGTLLEMNAAGLAMIECLDINLVRGKSVFDIVAPEDRDSYRVFHDHICRGGRGTLEFDIIGLGGVRRRMQCHAVPFRVALDEPWSHLGITVDVTERRKGEQALRERTERYELVAAGACDAIWDWDVPNHRVFFSPRWKELRGFGPDEIGDREVEWSTRIHPDDAPRVMAALDAHFFGKTAVFSEEYRTQCKDGSWKWIIDRGIAQRDAAGRVVRMAGSESDITERKRAEEALRESEERYRDLFENAHDLIQCIDPQGRFLYVNQAWLRALGYHSNELKNLTICDVIHEESKEQYRGIFQQFLSGSADSLERFEVVFRTKDQRRIVLEGNMSVRRVADQPVHLRGIFRDITDRKQLESQILNAQTLESLGVLAGGIAHDFNNLLTSVMGYASLALMQIPDESPACPMLHEIENAAQRASDLTQQMLAYSGKGKFVIQTLRLDTLVQEMTKLLRTVVSKKATVELHLDPATIEGDATQVRQVAMNLITNASDALEGREGIIRIRTGMRRADASYLRSPFVPEELPADTYAFVEVEDSGCGMDEETMARIFDPYFTTKFTGRGLGLAAVIGIVRGHRGTIKVTSTPKQGTTFEVLFPRAATEHSRPGTRFVSPPPRGQGTVLVIEDEPSVRTFVRKVLESAGLEVRIACDGREGLEVFALHHNEIAAVLLDLTMPRVDGLEVLRELRNQAPEVPVLVMSGFSETEVVTRFAGLGATGFIQKPFLPRDLLARMYPLLPHRATELVHP